MSCVVIASAAPRSIAFSAAFMLPLRSFGRRYLKYSSSPNSVNSVSVRGSSSSRLRPAPPNASLASSWSDASCSRCRRSFSDSASPPAPDAAACAPAPPPAAAAPPFLSPAFLSAVFLGFCAAPRQREGGEGQRMFTRAGFSSSSSSSASEVTGASAGFTGSGTSYSSSSAHGRVRGRADSLRFPLRTPRQVIPHIGDEAASLRASDWLAAATARAVVNAARSWEVGPKNSSGKLGAGGGGELIC